MFLTIVKDSIVLFLLVYSLIQLAEKCLSYLVQKVKCSKHDAKEFYILNIINIPANCLEDQIRSIIHRKQGRILLLTSESVDAESATILKLLCKEFSQIVPVPCSSLATYITNEAEQIS